MKTIKRILSMLICLALVMGLFSVINNFLERKGSYVKNADFYDYKEDYEVLFLGSSHMVMGIAPMELWIDYGITSYNMGNYGQWIPLDYWVLENALDYTRPKLVVIDVHAIGNDDMYSEAHISQMHEVFDMMPFSANKLKAVRDILPKEKYMEFLFSFSFYHTRWSEINSSFWNEIETSTEKGANLDNPSSMKGAIVCECKEPVWIDISSKNEKETIGKEYLRKIIELCQREKIDVLLVALPYVPSEGNQEYLNSVQDIANEYGINYLNMNLEYDYLNYKTDLYDEGHLNSSGAKKTTCALGQYLTRVYNLPDERNKEVSDIWEKDYQKYADYKVEWMKQQTNLDSYLMLLANDKYKIVAEVYDTTIWNVPIYRELFENLGVDLKQLGSMTGYIMIDPQMGIVDIPVEKITGDQDEYASIRLTVINTLTDSIVDCVGWRYEVHETDGVYFLTTTDVFR